jgi:sugar-specific transcriptional regulator TrmB
MDSLPLQTRQTLRMLGFSENESKLLLPLFTHRVRTARELSREALLSFDAVHFALHALERKALLRRTDVGGEERVELCSDEEFLAWIGQQKARNAAVYDDAQRLLDHCFRQVRESSWKPAILYFEGRQGVIEIYEDMLTEGQAISGWTDILKIRGALGGYMDEFIARRVERGITSYAILPRNRLNREYARMDQLRQVQFSDHLPIDGEIRIYGEKVAVITFHEERPVGLVLRGRLIASVFRGIFAQAWNRA